MSIRVRIEGQEIQMDQRFQQVSLLLAELIQQSGGDEVFELSSDFITMQQFKIIQQYYEQNNFKPNDIILKSDEPSEVFSQQDQNLIMSFNPLEGGEMVKLLQAAIYLNLKHFKNLCLARIAIEFFVGKQNPQKYLEKLQKKFPSVPSLTIQDIDNYKNQYPFLFNEFF